jgi:hypothetical protein
MRYNTLLSKFAWQIFRQRDKKNQILTRNSKPFKPHKKNNFMKTIPVSQQVLVLAARIIYNNVLSNIGRFTAYKAKYNDDFINQLQTDATDAANMPSEQERAREHKELRVAMVDQSKICRMKWQMLGGYIAEAYAGNDQNINTNKNAAGWKYYENASGESWSSVTGLMQEGKTYIQNNLDKLTADGHMPTTFPTEFKTAFTDFTTMQNNFYAAQHTAHAGTVSKSNSMNDVYISCIACCKDGVIIAGDDAEFAQLFSFERAVAMVEPQGASAVAADVTNSATGLPLAGADVSVVGTDKSTVTDAGGRGEINQLASGPVQIKVSADGFTDQFINTTLTGTRQRIDVSMVPLFAGAAVTEQGPIIHHPVQETVLAN